MTKKESTNWLSKEDNRSKEAIKTGKEVINPSAIKKPEEKIGKINKPNKKETENNYVNILIDSNVENRFRYIVTLRQGLELRNGNKKPTIGEVFEEMVMHFENKLKI